VLRDDFDTVMRFWHCPKPTIAAVNGPALAGGCELALACDITLAAEGALFGEPELRFGAGIVVMLLPWITGPKRAKELLLTGTDQIAADEAAAMGLVNRVVPATDLIDDALTMAGTMATMDPALIRTTKAAINRCYTMMGLDQGLEAALADDVAFEGRGSDDKRRFLELVRTEGMRAALAWRESRFAR
jgi:enoyl-CoA hydratase